MSAPERAAAVEPAAKCSHCRLLGGDCPACFHCGGLTCKCKSRCPQALFFEATRVQCRVGGEELTQDHCPAGKALRDLREQDYPEPGYRYETQPDQSNLERWLFEADARFDAAHDAEQKAVENLDAWTAKWGKGYSGWADAEMVFAMGFALWARMRVGASDVLPTIRQHLDRFTGRSYEERPPFGNAGAAYEFWVRGETAIGRGTGRNYNLAEDRDEDIRARARARHKGVEFMPAKQSMNGHTGGAVGEDRVGLRADVEQAIKAAKLETIDMVILHHLRILKTTAGNLAKALKDHAGLEMSREAVGKRASRALNRIGERLLERQLIPGSSVRPRVRPPEARDMAPEQIRVRP